MATLETYHDSGVNPNSPVLDELPALQYVRNIPDKALAHVPVTLGSCTHA